MRAQDDWRLTNQEKYLQGVTLLWKTYAPYSENWDHNHCVFCWQKFMNADAPGILRAGYATGDERHWICATCFQDFQDLFNWTVLKTSEESANKSY